MTAFKQNVFSGLLPRMPDGLLPVNNATIAQNCDFAYGELRNTKDGYLVNSMSNSPQSIYTDDGITFYTWTVDVDAARSPLVADSYNRLYYTGDSGFKVTDRLATASNGGAPPWSYLVGVPKPTVKPGLTIQLPTIDTSTTNYAFAFHYEYQGIKYQEQAIGPTTIGTNNWSMTAPALGGSTPTGATAVFRVTGTSLADGSQTFDVYTANSSLASSGGIYKLDMLPISGLTFNVVLSIGIPEASKETRAVVYTYVNSYGEEGPPSPANETTTSPQIGTVNQCTLDTITGYAPIVEIRCYRTPSGSSGIAEYFYAGSLDVTGLSPGVYNFTDTVSADLLNEPLQSADWYPPSQSLVGLIALPNGILCAFKGNELWFCEAYKPWAWPPQYVKPLTHHIVGTLAYGSGAFVTTTAQPYVVSGVSPDAMTASKINVDQAGVSKWSIAMAGGYLLYASNDGLVAVGGGSASLAQSQKFFTREVWRTKYAAGLSSMRFAVWDGRLVGYSAAGSFTPFMIRFDEADGTLTDLPNFAAACSFTSVMADQLYYGSGSGVYEFNGGSDQTATWQSREIVIETPTNYGAAQAVVTGSWTLYLYAADVDTGVFALKLTKTLSAGINNFRLPPGFKADRWQYKMVGAGRFRELRIANTMAELAKV